MSEKTAVAWDVVYMNFNTCFGDSVKAVPYSGDGIGVVLVLALGKTDGRVGGGWGRENA